MDENSTICAVSTPQGAGGISVIRISGENAIDIAAKIFRPFGGKRVEDMQGHTCAYGAVISNGERIDDAVLTVFRAPKSYTGENTAELSCHGGIYLTRRVLRACIENGARPAEAGEFTKRAFLNGKMSLTQAESVMELISASGENALRSANCVREGKLFGQIKAACDTLVGLLADLAAWNDYPDEDIPSVETENMKNSLGSIKNQLDDILKNYDRGRIFRNGVDTAIIGKPNVGKSTLMNMLLGYKRSIVTDTAGTTRDVIEESCELSGVLLRLSDTAGIRTSDNEIESIGVEFAQDKLESCELAIAVFDSSQPLDGGDRDILKSLEGKNAVVVLNKTDLPQAVTEADFPQFERIARISAKQGKGLAELENAIISALGLQTYEPQSAMFANERQKDCALGAVKYISAASEALESGETLDAVTVMLDMAADRLLELTGEKATEAVVEQVFSRFCVGK